MPSSKPSDFEAARTVPIARMRLIADSYLRLTGKRLLTAAPLDDEAFRLAMWEAPRAIVAHDTEDDPVFFYGNRLALELFEMSFGDFVQLPSRYSAEPLARESRAKLLECVASQGYVDDYSGVRISGKGHRFRIEATTIWNLIDAEGQPCGQAATFTDFTPL